MFPVPGVTSSASCARSFYGLKEPLRERVYLKDQALVVLEILLVRDIFNPLCSDKEGNHKQSDCTRDCTIARHNYSNRYSLHIA